MERKEKAVRDPHVAAQFPTKESNWNGTTSQPLLVKKRFPDEISYKVQTSSPSNNINPMQDIGKGGNIKESLIQNQRLMVGTCSVGCSVRPHPGPGILGSRPAGYQAPLGADKMRSHHKNNVAHSHNSVLQAQGLRSSHHEQLARAAQEARGWPTVYSYHPENFAGKGKYEDGDDDSNNPYYPFPTHLIDMEDFS